MGRAKKGKKSTVKNEDIGSGDEEKIPTQKKRGRPTKPLKEEFEEDEIDKIDEENSESGKTSVVTKEVIKIPPGVENGKKRKRNSQTKDKADSVKEDNGNGAKDESTKKSNGYRLNGSRRKNKPRRAAEAGVECR
ncbi:hypothetical protein ACFE04_007892 [Oxalis oulophora]